MWYCYREISHSCLKRDLQWDASIVPPTLTTCNLRRVSNVGANGEGSLSTGTVYTNLSKLQFRGSKSICRVKPVLIQAAEKLRRSGSNVSWQTKKCLNLERLHYNLVPFMQYAILNLTYFLSSFLSQGVTFTISSIHNFSRTCLLMSRTDLWIYGISSSSS